MPKKTQSQKPEAKSPEELKQQINQLTEALQRERADAENVRKRAENERLHLGEFYKAMIVRELLPAVDNLERALLHTPKDLKNHGYVKGVKSVAKQFEDCFSKLGVKRIKTAGEVFDPKLHEAISVDVSAEASAEEEDAGGEVEVVCEELQPGYILGDEVIRHAMVRVKMEGTSKE